MTAYPYLKILPPEDYVDVAMSHLEDMLRMSEGYSPTVRAMQNAIGAAVSQRILSSRLAQDGLEHFVKSYGAYSRWLAAPGHSQYWCHREAFSEISRGMLDRPRLNWPFAVRLVVGRELLNLLMFNVTVDVDGEGTLVVDGRRVVFSADKDFTSLASDAGQLVAPCSSCPALFKVFRARKSLQQREEIKPLPSLTRLFAADKLRRLHFKAKDLPMVVPPLPWLSETEGGLLLCQSDLLRVLDGLGGGEDGAGAAKQHPLKLRPTLDGLNQLGSTPWRINKALLDIAAEVFSKQQDYRDYLARLSIPWRGDLLVSPPKMDGELQRKMASGERLGADDLKEYNEHLAERVAFNQFRSESYALWCDCLYRLSIANHYRDEEALFFPHNIDFRGRVYPIAPYLNHMGGDLARSLLVFAKAKPLGERGLRWLKLHAVNLSGLKKRDSVAQRLRYAEEVLPEILLSAEKPFDGQRWWMQSDEPWQTLGACMEIRDALAWPQGHEHFPSRLPVHQDGSCNGLQHYAALGRDVLGAGAVNLLPAENPQDVYSEIAAVVEQKRAADEADDVPLAKILAGFVQRKVIKQTVMTTVYGVTKYGAKLQIARQLKDKDEFPLEHVEEAAKYLTNKTFESLNGMPLGTKRANVPSQSCSRCLRRSKPGSPSAPTSSLSTSTARWPGGRHWACAWINHTSNK